MRSPENKEKTLRNISEYLREHVVPEIHGREIFGAETTYSEIGEAFICHGSAMMISAGKYKDLFMLLCAVTEGAEKAHEILGDNKKKKQ